MSQTKEGEQAEEEAAPADTKKDAATRAREEAEEAERVRATRRRTEENASKQAEVEAKGKEVEQIKAMTDKARQDQEHEIENAKVTAEHVPAVKDDDMKLEGNDRASIIALELENYTGLPKCLQRLTTAGGATAYSTRWQHSSKAPLICR